MIPRFVAMRENAEVIKDQLLNRMTKEQVKEYAQVRIDEISDLPRRDPAKRHPDGYLMVMLWREVSRRATAKRHDDGHRIWW